MAERGGISVEVVSRARRSVVAVLGQSSRGSGFFALPNGLIVTSRQVVGYELSARIVTDDGRAVEGRVVHADVARDLAFLMPREPIKAAPLRSAPAAPRLGESVLVLGHAAHGPLLMPGIVAAVERVIGGLPFLQIDAAPAPELQGAPLVDIEGRVLGVVTHPSAVSGGNGYDEDEHPGLILPLVALEPALGRLAGSPASLVGQEPTYECPACATAFTPDTDRCLHCGALLPHGVPLERALAGMDPGEAPPLAFDPGAAPPIAAVRTVKEILATVGIVEGRARRGARQWAVRQEGATTGAAGETISLAIDATGRYLLLRVPVARVDPRAPEPLFRLLLTLNDETAGIYRLSLSGGVVYLSSSEPVESYLGRDFGALLAELVRLAGHYRKVLGDAFGAAEVPAG